MDYFITFFSGHIIEFYLTAIVIIFIVVGFVFRSFTKRGKIITKKTVSFIREYENDGEI